LTFNTAAALETFISEAAGLAEHASSLNPE